ncbi:head-tail adaptor protein [Sphingorhabdus soli]|uniref:Head-tail adaptor protein n=1 Tax=Flavisphingopyxis soli TaxID=2601267 RepID=A0A5C6UL79_9SPHN|nr:head-tail adaptor protein [Sphingorhabdus soli]TXC73962.1 head-tail adaptor protein [Sphingorhabdus soli]
MDAGERDRLIVFQAVTSAENDFGEPVGTGFAEVGREWAKITYGTGSERREAGIEGNDLPATFRTLQNAMTRSITTKHVIYFDGAVWDITSAVPWKREDMDFTAQRRAL